MSRVSFVASAFRLVLGVLLLQNCQSNHRSWLVSAEALYASAIPKADEQAVEGALCLLSGGSALQCPSAIVAGAVSCFSELTEGHGCTSSSSIATASAAPVYFGSFTTASGECVVFKQVRDAWYAETCQGSLPVKSQETVGTYLCWLHNQESCVSRTRVHIMHALNEPRNWCVYLGKVGLLGGTRTPGSQLSPTGTLVHYATVSSITMAFGAKEWQRYLGVDLEYYLSLFVGRGNIMSESEKQSRIGVDPCYCG
jgi:hypothetical protein